MSGTGTDMALPLRRLDGVAHVGDRIGSDSGRRSRVAVVTIRILFFLTIANVATLITRAAVTEIPFNPLAFALLAPFTLAYRAMHSGLRRLFIAGNLTVFLFVVLGFLGGGAGAQSRYETVQVCVKLWIALVGVPWAVERLGHEEMKRLIVWGGWVVTAGALLAAVQYVWPSPFLAIVSQPGRGAGLWVNPNNCGFLCATYFLLWGLVEHPGRVARVIVPAILLVGVLVSLSRASMAGLLLALGYKAIASRRPGAAFAGAVVAAILYIGVQVFAPQGAEQAKTDVRRAAVASLLAGDLESVKETENRTDIWAYCIEAIGDQWLFGLGHGSMNRIVPMGEAGLGPHNFYIYVLGNSGIVALTMFVLFLLRARREALRCATRETRSMSVAIILLYAFCLFFDHALALHQFSAIAFISLAFARSISARRTGGGSQDVGQPVATRGRMMHWAGDIAVRVTSASGPSL
jgi:O-antigen ligase